ncbi:lactate racemase domain-containing protein [Tessaracoccus sp. Z1128]
MSRPGFVLEVDDKTPPLLTMAGADVRQERMGLGTRVVYPADAVPSTDPVALIDAALAAPLGAEPLAAQLKPDTRLTIVVVDSTRPLPRPEFEIRRTLVERVLETAARAGVDDVELVIATGLRQRWNAAHITDVLGDRVATSFLPDGLVSSHDVTASDLVTLGDVDGAPVRFNRRVASSDLVVLVSARADSGEQCPFVAGLADVRTLNRLQGVERDDEYCRAVERLVHDTVRTFAVVAVLGQPLLSRSLRFASKREWEWSLADKLSLAGARQIVAALPRQGAQLLHGNPRADYAVVDVLGGDHARVFADSRLVWKAANAVELKGRSDVLVTSVWGASIDEGDPVGSPLSAAHHALVTRAGSHVGTPYTREGGALIAFHPLRKRFSNRRQSAAADFFATVLPQTTDPAEIAAVYEPRAIDDEWYLDLYRKQFAEHPLRVFHQWYATARAAAHFSDVVWVGGDRRSAALLGHRAATTYADALEIASNHVGPTPSITVLRGPGLALGDVR